MFIDMNFRVEFEDEKKFVFHILPYTNLNPDLYIQHQINNIIHSKYI